MEYLLVKEHGAVVAVPPSQYLPGRQERVGCLDVQEGDFRDDHMEVVPHTSLDERANKLLFLARFVPDRPYPPATGLFVVRRGPVIYKGKHLVAPGVEDLIDANSWLGYAIQNWSGSCEVEWAGYLNGPCRLHVPPPSMVGTIPRK